MYEPLYTPFRLRQSRVASATGAARRARLLAVLLAVLLCAAPAGAGEGATAETIRQAEELLALSQQQNLSDHVLGLKTAQEALALWQTTNEQDGIARAYTQIAECYAAQNALPDAIQNYQNALQLWRDLHNPDKEAEILINLGFVDARKGEWQSSIAFLMQAQDLVEEKNEPLRMAQITGGLAYIFNESGMPENGLVQYQRALEYFQQVPNPRGAMLMTIGLGTTYYSLENYTEAITQLQQALASVEPDSIDAALCHLYLGKVYSSTGEYAVALQHLQIALPIYTKAHNPGEAAQVRALMGQIYEKQGQPEQARPYYSQALDEFTGLTDLINQAAVSYALGRMELRSENYDAAENYLRQSIETTENLRRASASSDLTAAFSATIYERYERYIACLMSGHERQPGTGLDVRAFETSELARARSLAELLQATGTNLVSGLDPQLAEQERTLRQALRVKEDARIALLSQENYSKEARAALDAEVAQLEAQYKQVSESIRARYPAYEQFTHPSAWDLRRIQEQVIADDQTLLLEYSLGVEKSYVWAVTRNGLKSYELASQAQIVAAAQKAYKLLSAKPVAGAPDELTPALQELSRLILAPVAAELNRPRIIVVADSALNYIPFQLLPAPTSASEPLVSNYEVINTPSATILGELRQEASQRRQAAKTLAAFGAPVFASNYAEVTGSKDGTQLASAQRLESYQWQQALRDIELNGDSFDPSVIKPLFFAKQELSNLSRVVAARDDALVASEFDATRERLQSTDLTQYAILHFATHGLLDPKRPENSGLVLSTVNREGRAQNGFVGLQDVYGLRAPVRLVVLSACQTGLGKDVRGEGLLGLTRGFMYAGASSVVASLWKVDDEATAELMKAFYNNLLDKGMTPAEALRAAQNSIRQKPEWRAPFYWAGFTLQGEYRQVIKPKPSFFASPFNLKMIAGGALLLLLAFVPLWYRRHRRNDGSPSGA